MNFIGFSDLKIYIYKNFEKKNGYKLKMLLFMVNKEKDIYLFDIFIEKYFIVLDKIMV